jgi:eukaryotic-like serine/threonine-protein kinase
LLDCLGVDEPRPGELLGRYVLRHELGRGAMGTVYAAIDPELDRMVAIKLLHADAARDRSRASFLREAKATAGLTHRNVVTIHDVGVVGDQLFLAMELIEGPTLRQWLQPGRPWREVLAVLCEAGAGLVAAHDVGIVHRDFKPDNVLLAIDPQRSSAFGRVVVTDFGLAHRPLELTTPDVEGIAEAPSGSLAIDATHDGAFQGTAAYAAPEQHRGGRCDARSDQFSFCVTLYEALWGERPFAGDTADEVLAEITAGRVREPAGGRKVPRRLRRAVLRGLAAAPGERFLDLRALLAAIDPRRRRSPATLLVGSAAVAAALGFAIAGQRPEPVRASYCDRAAERLHGVWDEPVREAIEAAFTATHEPSAADAWLAVSSRLDGFATAWVAAQTEACRAGEDGSVAADVLSQRTTCLERELARAGAVAEALRTADRQAVLRSTESVAHLGSPELCLDDRHLSRRAAARADIDPLIQLEIDAVLTRADALNDTAKYEESERLGRDGLARARAIGDRWAEAEALLVIGVAQQWLQDPGAEQSFHDALNAALRVDHHRVGALAMIGLLELWDPDTDGGITRAEQWERHCSAMISALGGDPAIEIELAVALGNVYLKNGHYDRAEQVYERALALRRSAQDDIRLAGAQANLGAIAAAHGRYRDALDRFRKGQGALVGVYGPRHPNVAGASINVGSALAELGELEAARDEHLHALEVYEENFGPEHASLAPALRMLAWNALARRKYAEALPYAERALAIARREGPRSESTARSLSMVSSIIVELGRVDEARAQTDEALSIARAVFGDEHPTLSEFENECGLTATRTGDFVAAREHFDRAIALRERTLGPNDSEIGRAWAGIAELELAQHHRAAAVTAATRAFEITTMPGNERGGAGAEATFLLARALMTDGDRAARTRARELAERVRTEFVATGPGWVGRGDEVAAWLAAARKD